MPPTIQMMKMALPLQKPTQSTVKFRHSGIFQDNPTGTFPVRMKKRAGTVEAILTSSNPLTTGSPPSAEPLGWNYAAQVSVQKPGKQPKPHRGWVRFHLLNQELGGTGKDVRNLVPTLNSYNTGALWRNFEEEAKYYYYKGAIAFEVEVAYHQNVVSNPGQVGDDQLHKFPRTITGEFKYFNDVQDRWESPPLNGRVTLNIAAPSVTPGNVEFILTECSELTLTKVFAVNVNLARRLVSMQRLLAQQAPATVQALYDLLYDNIVIYGFGTGCATPSELNMYWGALERALNLRSGTALRIYPGWQPDGTSAMKRTEHSVGEIMLAGDQKLQSLSQLLGVDVSVLRLIKSLDLRFTDTASGLYRNLTHQMHSPNQFLYFDKFQWPQIMSALKPGPHHIGGIRIDEVKTKTQVMHEERQQALRRQEEQRLRAEEEKRQKELLEMQRQEALRLQEERRELERQQRREREQPIRHIWAQLIRLMNTFEQGTLSNKAWREFRHKAREVIDAVYERVRQKLEAGQYNPDVDYLEYYKVRDTLLGKWIGASVKYPNKKKNTLKRVELK